MPIEHAEETEEDDDDDERWLWVECEGSREGYRDMELFIAAFDDADQLDRLVSPSTDEAPSVGSRTSWRGGQNCSNGCTPSARIGSADGLGRGWPARPSPSLLPMATGRRPLLPFLARDRAAIRAGGRHASLRRLRTRQRRAERD